MVYWWPLRYFKDIQTCCSAILLAFYVSNYARLRYRSWCLSEIQDRDSITCRSSSTISNSLLGLGWCDIRFYWRIPPSYGDDTILVVVDAHLLNVAHPFTTKIVAENFIKGVMILHGMPRSIIISDHDSNFLNKVW